MRGAIIIIMALDHVRDFLHSGAMAFSPTDLTRTTALLFFTRWITHFCAPVFAFTAGIGAFLWARRHNVNELSRFLVVRGLWLMLLDFTVIRFLMFFAVRFSGTLVLVSVLWVLGLSMVVLAVLIHLPARWIATMSVVAIASHNLLDRIRPAQLGGAAWVWDILHSPSVFQFHGASFLFAYSLIPWFAVMAGGYCLGVVMLWPSPKRRQFLAGLGVALTIAFVVMRAINVYGDPFRWSVQRSPLFTALSFLNTTKYPPSLLFLLMTMGPAIVAMAWLERVEFSAANPVVVFGRVPFFFFVAHLAVIHAVTVALNFLRYGAAPFLLEAGPSMGGPRSAFPPDYGFSLWVVYAVWVAVVVALYPACLWFARVRERRYQTRHALTRTIGASALHENAS